MKRALARRWADRVVRVYASAALRVAGFSSAAVALASLPPLEVPVDAREDDAVDEARSRVNAALVSVLAAREIPQTEAALVATLAAREAVALASLENPSETDLKRLVEAMHAIA